jgi:hypothetical protein
MSKGGLPRPQARHYWLVGYLVILQEIPARILMELTAWMLPLHHGREILTVLADLWVSLFKFCFYNLAYGGHMLCRILCRAHHFITARHPARQNSYSILFQLDAHSFALKPSGV